MRPRLTGQTRPSTGNVYGRGRSAIGQFDGSVRQGLGDTRPIPACAFVTKNFHRRGDRIDRQARSILIKEDLGSRVYATAKYRDCLDEDGRFASG